MSRKKSGCFAFFAILLLLALLTGGGYLTFKSYTKLQKKIVSEINALPPFNQEAASKEVAESLNLDLPVQEPSITEDQVFENTKKELKKIAKIKSLF